MKDFKNLFVNTVLIILTFSCFVFFIFSDYIRLSGHAISALIIILPVFLHQKWEGFKKTFSKKITENLQIILALTCFLNLLGSVNFYYSGRADWYDTFIHFLTPALLFILTAAIPIIIQKIFFKKTYLWLTLFINFIIIILFSLIWEFYEYLIDSIFNTTMFGQQGEVYLDTITDLIADMIGGFFSTWLLYAYFYDYIVRNITIGKANK